MNRRRWLPVLFVYLGLLGLIGCIYLPSFDRPRTPEGRDPRKLVGEAGSGCAIVPGKVDINFVRKLLGKPNVATDDLHAIGYEYTWEVGHWYGLCAGRGWEPLAVVQDPADQVRYLFLRFDEHGMLLDFRWASREVPSYPGFKPDMAADREWKSFRADK